MPIYDYSCVRCGPFTLSRPLAEYAQAQPCPVCGTEAPRAMLSAPTIGGKRAALDPRLLRSTGSDLLRPRAHPAGCGCCFSRAGGSLRADAPKVTRLPGQAS